MSKIKHRPGPPKMATEDSLNLRALRTLDSEWELYQRAAKSAGLNTSAWLRQVATRAARRQLKSK